MPLLLLGASSVNPKVQSYLSLVTSQYQNSPNMLGWLRANIQLFQDIIACAASLGAAFSLAGAVGSQLDAIGVIIGQSRTVAFQPSGGVSPVLDDATYRLLLQARVFQNHWKGTITGLRAGWRMLFPSGILIFQDNQDMTVNVYVAVPTTSIIQDLILNGYIIPRPQGVLYNISVGTLPLLGYDRNDSFEAGFEVGHFA